MGPTVSDNGGGSTPPVVSGRYRLEALIARGNLARIYAATDLTGGSRVALKWMRREFAGSRRALARFRLEYHTLCALRHPRIIEVYDYGDGDGQPYYTMELLTGKDLNTLSPVAYREACGYLRDVASSLSLLHAKRLLHRDPEPRNVRRSAGGRCKLLDFGTSVAFGVAGEVAGSPPMVAPEALRGMPLDHRADLYSLGALAYFLLTRRHAYRASRIQDLHILFATQPAPPSTVVPDIPAALDRLVMSLLNLDPMARPVSAADVVERLNAIGDLSPEAPLQYARGYYLKPPLVGRRKTMSRLRGRLEAAARGEGNACLVESNPGVGKTRILEELSLRAQMSGALVVRVEARSNRGHYGVVRALSLSLLRTAPEEAAEALAPLRATLGHLLPELGVPPDQLAALPEEIGERRMSIQSALLSWFARLGQDRPLVVMVDDVHRADEESAAFLASLAIETEGRRLMIVATRALWAIMSATAALKSLSASSRRLRLHRLRYRNTAELVRSLFGDVPNSDRLASWMHAISTGNAMQNVELARNLVERGLVRYADGGWVLPETVSEKEIPFGLSEAMLSRASSLSARALALADALCVRRGSIPLDLCLAVVEEEDEAAVFDSLAELVSQGVLESCGDAYHFSQEPFRETLLDRLPPQRRQKLHRRLGLALLRHGDLTLEEQVEAGWHLLHGGDHARGADMLAVTARRLALQEDNLSAAVPAAEAALAVYEAEHRSPAECLMLRAQLVEWSPYSDRQDLAPRYGDETMGLLYGHSGLRLAFRLRRYLGARLSLVCGLGLTALGNVLRSRRRRRLTIVVALDRFLRCLSSLVGATAVFLDSDAIRRLSLLAMPLTGFGRRNVAYAIYLYCRAHEAHHTGRLRAAGLLFDRLIEMLDDPTACRGMVDEKRRALKLAAQFGRAVPQAMSGRTSAQTLARRLQQSGSKLGEVAAHRIQMVYHLFRGERDRAGEHRRKVEMHGIRGGSTWQVDFFFAPVHGVAGIMTLDIGGLKHALQVLERLIRQAPYLQRLSNVLRVVHLSLRGQNEDAIALGERLLEQQPPWKGVFWIDVRGALALALNNAGASGMARQICEETIGLLGEERIETYSHILVAYELARAEMGSGNLQRASEIVDRLEADNLEDGSPLLLGRCHQLRALMALRTGDRESFDRHLAGMTARFTETGNPVLLAQARHVADLGAQDKVLKSVPPIAVEDEDDVDTAVEFTAVSPELDTLFDGCDRPDRRAERALGFLLRSVERSSGYLYLVGKEELLLACRIEADDPVEQLEQQVRDHVDAFLEVAPARASDEASTRDAVAQAGIFWVGDATSFATYLLTARDKSRLSVVGVAAIDFGDARPLRLNARLLQAVGRKLIDAGDVALNPDYQDDDTVRTEDA
jgi:hypothetical protein